MRQLKVSMVMPCYNKVESIGEMFDSIIAQEWDNIELVLVNDGSTDGTRKVIAEYETEFINRGYEVVIVDQENAGVCAAARAGFERITGDLVCTVDSDDELDPKYVSTMAGWLAEHDEYDYAVCEALHYTGRGEHKLFQPFEPKEIPDGDPYLVERWLLDDIHVQPWRYMLRTVYFRKCRIVETYHTQTEGSHEPGYVIPILAHHGKLKYFPLPLYHFNVDMGSHSRGEYVSQIDKFMSEYVTLCKIAIDALPDCIATPQKKEKWQYAAVISKLFTLHQFAIHKARSAQNELLNIVNTTFAVHPGITPHRTENLEPVFFEMVKNCLITPKHRIIGCEALNKDNAYFFNSMEGAPLEPTELWDSAGDGVMAKKADYAALNRNDIAIVGPFGDQKVIDKLEKTGCTILRDCDIYARQQQYADFPELIKMGRPGRFGKYAENSRTDYFAKYIFPFDLIEKGKNIVLYGAGKVGEAFYHQLEMTCYGNLLMWCDENYANIKKEHVISNPQMIAQLPYDYIILAVEKKRIAYEMKNSLVGRGIDETKIIWMSPIIYRK